MLAAHGQSAAVETNPLRALERVREETPAVLILDLNMPGMTGTELLENLVAGQVATKTVVVSGENAVATLSPLLRLGAYDFLAKPFDPEQLLRAVDHALSAWKLERENKVMRAREERANRLSRFLLDAFPDMLYMLDRDGRFSFVNNRLRHLFARDRGTLSGQPWQQLFADEALRETLEHHFNERRQGERRTQRLEFELTTADGDTAVLECSARGLYTNGEGESGRRFRGTYGVLQDVTELRRVRRAQVESERKFEALFMESPDMVFISRPDTGEVLQGNPRFEQLRLSTGAAPTPATDHFLWPRAAAREEFVELLRRSPDHLSFSVDLPIAGESRNLELQARLVDVDAQQCLLATVRDRTRERLAQLQQLELQTQLQQAGKMEALGQLAGGIAHDFNNILASIIGYAELVLSSRKRLDDAKLDTYLGEVVSAGHRARDLISQMLTFTRATRGEPLLVDLAENIDSVSRMLRAAIPSMITVNTEFADDLPLVRVDPVQLQQVVMNLMINARDAIEGRGSIRLGGELSDSGTPCRVCGESLSGPHVVLSVTDTGHGISAENMDSIFGMYFTTREPGKGTGIGLWLVDSMVHAAGGHITVDSQAGRGTTFSIHLPLPGERGDNEAARVPSARLSGRIVIVDDEVSVSSILGELLRHAGYEITVFNDSSRALDYLVQHIDDIALLLTDQSMPMLSGLDLAQFVKGRRPELPVILMTGFAQAQDMRRLEESGVDHFLRKPFGVDDLLEVVNAVVDRSQSPTTNQDVSS
ncbi:MAG: response regulator [Pseudomonadales bacterium]|nr:response regulator [Pseudomonadales bacterium]